MAKVFISYRRGDSAAAAGRIYERLAAGFGKTAIFKDVDNIPLAVNFRDYIADVIQQCAVQLVVIGPQWLAATNAAGGRRLDDPNDLVRLEVEAGLSRGIAVIPLLVGGAQMPNPDTLPPTLRALCQRNGLIVRDAPSDFDQDMTQVFATVARWVKPAPSPATGQARLLSTTLTYGIVLALLFIPGTALEALESDTVSSSSSASSSAGSTPLVLFLALLLVPDAVASIMAGRAVARRTGQTWSGARAAALASGLGGLLGGGLYGWLLANDVVISSGSHPDAVSSMFVSALVGLVLGLLIGLALGAVGGSIGRRGARQRLSQTAVAPR